MENTVFEDVLLPAYLIRGEWWFAEPWFVNLDFAGLIKTGGSQRWDGSIGLGLQLKLASVRIGYRRFEDDLDATKLFSKLTSDVAFVSLAIDFF